MNTPIYEGQNIVPKSDFRSSLPNSIIQQSNNTQQLINVLGATTNTIAKYAQPQINQETVQRALKDIEDGNVNSDNVSLVAQQVYKETAIYSLNADVEIRGNELAKRIELEQAKTGSYDVNAFDKAWKGYTKSTLSTIKDPIIKTQIENRLSRLGVGYSGSFATLQMKQTRDLQEKNFKALLDLKSENLNAAMGVSEQGTLEAQQEIQDTLNIMVNAGFLAPAEAEFFNKKANKNAVMNMITKDVNKAIQNGTIYEVYDNIMKNETITSVFNADEIGELQATIWSNLSQNDKIRNNEIEQEQKQIEYERENTINELNSLYVTGDLDLPKLQNLLGEGKISLSTYNDYTTQMKNGSVMVDDGSKLLFVETNLLDVTESEIYNAPYFTNETKSRLIQKRRSDIEDKGNWLSTQTGREARDMISRTFNIEEGTLLSSLSFDNATMREYDQMKRDFYAQVQALPLEQRENKSLLVADNLIKKYYADKKALEDATIKQMEEQKKLKEQQEAEAYKNSITGKFMNMFKSNTKTDGDFENEFSKGLENKTNRHIFDTIGETNE